MTVLLVFLMGWGVFPLTNRIRQNLKEKHARHIADLRAYYESEINSLKQKLEAKEISAVEEWKKSNQVLVDR
jgi:M-phase phosphoprotein 9